MKCTVFRVNVPYFYASVPGNVDRMLAGLHGIQRDPLNTQRDPKSSQRNPQHETVEYSLLWVANMISSGIWA